MKLIISIVGASLVLTSCIAYNPYAMPRSDGKVYRSVVVTGTGQVVEITNRTQLGCQNERYATTSGSAGSILQQDCTPVEP